MGGTSTKLKPDAFYVVHGNGVVPHAEFEFERLYFEILYGKHAGNGVQHFVCACILDGLHHGVDVLLPLCERIRTERIPHFFAAGDVLRHDDGRFLTHYRGVRYPSEPWRVVYEVSVGHGRNDSGFFVQGKGQVHEQLFLLGEPVSVRKARIADIQIDMAYPVHRRFRGERSLHVPDSEVLCIYHHLAVEGRRRDELFGVETEDVGLSAFHIQAVYKIVVVQDMGTFGNGIRNPYLEDVD